MRVCFCFFFFFNDTATTEIYTLSLHDALPISVELVVQPQLDLALDNGAFAGRPLRAAAFRLARRAFARDQLATRLGRKRGADRKSTRLNSSHLVISYAVFCLKKKNLRTQACCS